MPYYLISSSSDESDADSNSGNKETATSEANSRQGNAMETSDSSHSDKESDEQQPGLPEAHGAGVLANDKEKTYGCREFWQWQFNDNDNDPLTITNLPRFSSAVAELQLIAASQYNERIELLPKIVATFVSRVRKTKQLIFGSDISFPGTRLLQNYDYYVLCICLAKKLHRINNNWADQSDYAIMNFSYNYCVSLHGVSCGHLRGPAQITRSFVRWIHLHLGLFSSLRVRNLKRKWLTRGFKVYRFTPIPYVTVLRIFLRDAKTNQRLMMHITRQPN